MADFCYGKIEFGGALKESLIDELVEAISEDCYSGHSTTEEAQEKFIEQIEACRNNPSVLTFEEEEARWGSFENIEGFCLDHGLIYLAYRQGSSEYLPEIVTNEYGQENNYVVDGCNDPLICRTRIRDVIRLIRDFKENPKKIPLVLASDLDKKTGYHIDKDIASLVAKNINKDPMDILELHVEQRYRGPEDVKIPPLTIVKG